nr:winged helix-turn-helix transcriptional regulator [Herbiconiux sp. VKM Ac-1786]
MELVGERWALLIVRDLLVGPRRYGELAAGLHRIPSNILAARLKELQAAGVIRRAPRSRVIVYELTPYGRELEPVVLALGAWGFKAMEEARDEQVITAESMTMDLRSAFRPRTALELPTTSYAGRFGAVDLLIRVNGDALEVTPGGDPAVAAGGGVGAGGEAGAAGGVSGVGAGGGVGAVDLAFSAGTGIRRLITGELAAGRAIETGVVEVLGGRVELLDRFASTFRVAA